MSIFDTSTRGTVDIPLPKNWKGKSDARKEMRRVWRGREDRDLATILYISIQAFGDQHGLNFYQVLDILNELRAEENLEETDSK